MTLAAPLTTPSNEYITQACVVCTLLAAGYFVSATAPADDPLDGNTGDYAARRVLQRELSHDGFWIVDLHGQG